MSYTVRTSQLFKGLPEFGSFPIEELRRDPPAQAIEVHLSALAGLVEGCALGQIGLRYCFLQPLQNLLRDHKLTEHARELVAENLLSGVVDVDFRNALETDDAAVTAALIGLDQAAAGSYAKESLNRF